MIKEYRELWRFPLTRNRRFQPFGTEPVPVSAVPVSIDYRVGS